MNKMKMKKVQEAQEAQGTQEVEQFHQSQKEASEYVKSVMRQGLEDGIRASVAAEWNRYRMKGDDGADTYQNAIYEIFMIGRVAAKALEDPEDFLVSSADGAR